MSIDARIDRVKLNEDGSGSLVLIDRPGGPGKPNGIAGQSELHYDTAPEEVTALEGCDIWGGSNSIVLGSVEIADRIGYTKIRFKDRETFLRAIREYK